MSTDHQLRITFWGVTASPFQLKVQSLADAQKIPWQRWPEQATTLQCISMLVSLRRAKRKGTLQRYGSQHPQLDEIPAVPFYRLNSDQLHFDSTGLAQHLDSVNSTSQPLIPSQSDLNFMCRLIDDAFDEFGLYMVHHNRWVTSARTNRMGEMTAGEFSSLAPGLLRRRMARQLAQRQSQRCPYLFSVAADNYESGVETALTPPARSGFPATHALLDQAWRQYLAAMETLLAKQPFLLGDRFTLADASAYGQLSMNLVDGKAQQLLQELAPLTHEWLCMIRDGKHGTSSGKLYLSEHLLSLIAIISDTFLPLMRQNETAYQQALDAGHTLFNEAAFDQGAAHYDGTLLNQPFRSVAKTFQVAVWRELQHCWQSLNEIDQQQLQSLYPPLANMASHDETPRSEKRL